MAQTNDDLLYIDDEYFTPDGYYTYIALPVIAQNSEFTLTSAVTRAVETSVSLSSAFTQTADNIRLRDAATALDTAVTLTADNSRLRDVDSALNTTATLTADGSRIRQFFERAVTGIRVDGLHHIEYQDAGITGAWGTSTVISMWVRKHRSNTSGRLLSNRTRVAPYTDYDSNRASVDISSTGTITLSVYNETGNFGGLNASYAFSWSDAVTADTEWHHVVLDCNTWTANQLTPNISWTLYVDGVSQGTESLTVGQLVNARGTYANWTSRVELGTGFNGALAQVWAGNRSTFTLSEFYSNGFVDSMPSGSVIYSLLDHPYDSTIIGKNYSDRNNTTTISLDDGTFKNGLRVQGYYIESDLFVDAAIIQLVNVNLASTFTQSVSVIKQVGITANLNTIATQTASGGRTRPFESTLEAFYTELAATAKTARSPITLESAFTQTVNIVVGKLATANLSVTATQTVNALVVKQFAADFDSAFTQTANNSRLRQSAVALDSASLVTVVNSRLRQSAVPLDSAFTQTADYLVLTAVSVNLAASFALAVDAAKVAIFSSTLSSAATQTTLASRRRSTPVTLAGFTAVLSDGYVIHIDPYLTYLIAQETRNSLITTDIRDYIIPQETRARLIPEETRIYGVDSDSRVNTIIGSPL